MEGWRWRIEVRQSALGIRAGDVAKAAGLAPSTYSGVIGAASANSDTLLRIEVALGVPRGWLLKECEAGELAREAATLPPPEWLVTERSRLVERTGTE